MFHHIIKISLVFLIFHLLPSCYISSTAERISEGGRVFFKPEPQKGVLYRRAPGGPLYARVQASQYSTYLAPYGTQLIVTVYERGAKMVPVSGLKPETWFIPVQKEEKRVNKGKDISYYLLDCCVANWFREDEFVVGDRVRSTLPVSCSCVRVGHLGGDYMELHVDRGMWWRYPLTFVDAIVVDVPLSVAGTVIQLPLILGCTLIYQLQGVPDHVTCSQSGTNEESVPLVKRK